MERFPKKLTLRLQRRAEGNLIRKLPAASNGLIDFSSNDYLGLARDGTLFKEAFTILNNSGLKCSGATGSRLLSGNHPLYLELENLLLEFHETKAALVFNSGYDANIGFFAAVPQRGDVIFYDELIHASIRDGIQMSNAKSYKFRHNDLEDLTSKTNSLGLHDARSDNSEVYIVTESVFSMDGDTPNLIETVGFCEENEYHLIVDEAHAIGVYGDQGRGLLQELKLHEKVFARIVTFGKAIGGHGAAILGSKDLKRYLVNFARSFIYTTALPPHSLATVLAAYQFLGRSSGVKKRQKLLENIKYFNHQIQDVGLDKRFVPSNSSIHCCIVPGNAKIKRLTRSMQEAGFNVKPILSPTVAKGKERIRFCLHSENDREQIAQVLEVLNQYLKE
ncbi:MAG: aminotransferase class I/II-fold pyridoxal phosphate-dependent enzyme [Bacteroidota bacterium]